MNDVSQEARARLAAEIAAAVQGRIDRHEPELQQIIAEEVELALASRPIDQALAQAARALGGQQAERIVITSTGRNKSGIVARLTQVISEFEGDIQDISQTIVGAYFTMVIVVDISGATSQGARFATLRQRLQQAGDELGIHVVALHDDILSTMHAV